jgi:hypothetical protein
VPLLLTVRPRVRAPPSRPSSQALVAILNLNAWFYEVLEAEEAAMEVRGCLTRCAHVWGETGRQTVCFTRFNLGWLEA